jgi:hypothetical protein
MCHAERSEASTWGRETLRFAQGDRTATVILRSWFDGLATSGHPNPLATSGHPNPLTLSLS